MRPSTSTRQVPTGFVKRALLYLSDHMMVLAVLYVASLLLGGLLFVWIEPGYTSKDLLDGVYWSDTVAMTVGFGDISPKSTWGKVFYIFYSKVWVWGLTPLIIAKIVTVIMFAKGSFTHNEQEWLFASIENICKHLGLPVYRQPHDFMEHEEWELTTTKGVEA